MAQKIIAIPVHKFTSDNVGAFAYSPEADFGKNDGWTNSWKGFLTFDSSQAGTQPVYRYVSEKPYFRYRYSTDANLNQPGWKYEGPTFWAFKTSSPSLRTIPVYELRSIDAHERYQYVTDFDTKFGDGWREVQKVFHVLGVF
jgi:hypothetical protein